MKIPGIIMKYAFMMNNNSKLALAFRMLNKEGNYQIYIRVIDIDCDNIQYYDMKLNTSSAIASLSLSKIDSKDRIIYSADPDRYIFKVLQADDQGKFISSQNGPIINRTIDGVYFSLLISPINNNFIIISAI